MKNVAIVGIQGVPAQYGGFETLVENIIGRNCSPHVKYTIFCSSKDEQNQLRIYKGARLKYIPLHANGVQSILYDIWGMMRTLRGYDDVVILGVSGCLFLPVYRLLNHHKIIINIDGLEFRRAKWGCIARWILKNSCGFAIKGADVIVADNRGIWNYVKDTYHQEATLIAYGGDHVLRNVSERHQLEILKKHSVLSGQYAITICRIEPENNSHIILKAFAETGKELLFIGNWNRSKYSRQLKEQYGQKNNIHLINSLYDLNELFALRNHCSIYVHGHSAGGTNPSLVEAMFFGMPILAFDVVYNRETTANKAFYFKDAKELEKLLNIGKPELSENGRAMKEIAQTRYLWKKIAKQYEDLY
jgi:glycosyltransferase involved in cell wall biosynthesis